ncbi:MAG: hypothetical protein SO016_00385 [Lachnospiraceae bacterium]|nr:hypothetical protein [Robinsoniella sp.]MDY3765144.1 hypothetical protein [Lachnospiraceae bacterium]
MIHVSNKKVREILEEIHEKMCQKTEDRENEKSDIILENRILNVLCLNFDYGPTKCAIAVNEKYGGDLDADQIITVFRNRKIANPVERKELLEWADEVAQLFARAISGDRAGYDRFEKKRKENALKSGRHHKMQERVAAIMIYAKYPELDLWGDAEKLQVLGSTMAKYFFYDMADAVANGYGFPMFESKKKRAAAEAQEKSMSYEQALRRMEQLEGTLERTNAMLKEMQDEFEEQIETSKVQELAEFFSKLNSEKYGCILDELLAVRKGVDLLQRERFQLPVEINGLLIMVKKLTQFVRDSHIDPIMKVNSKRRVKVSDIEFCNYEGTPFQNAEDEKNVIVVSPGWIYRDKEVQISRPKVREEQ